MTDEKALRVAVLISGSGTNLQAIIDRHADGGLPIDMIAVVSDNPGAKGLDRASSAGVPTHVVDFKSFTDRDDFNAALHVVLRELNPDLIVLAGYMRILATATVEDFRGRMINVHPSLLPAFPGLHTYQRVLDAGEEWHGTTVHYVIPELDAGPPIVQYRVRIGPDDTEQTLRERVQQGEYQIYPQAIEWIATGRVNVNDNRVSFDGAVLDAPILIDETTAS